MFYTHSKDMADIAVIKTGGKQYIASPGKKLKVEKLGGSPGEVVYFGDVLLVGDSDGANVQVGSPTVPDARVEGRIMKHGRAKKVMIFKYKPKKRYRVKRGHRQHYTEVEITKIAA